MRYYTVIFFIVALSLPSVCFGERPIDVLKQNIEEGIRILQDSQYDHLSNKKAQEEQLWIVTRRIFDFEEFSRRVLASY